MATKRLLFITPAILILLTACALITGCQSMPQYPAILLEADSLTMTRPDSALHVLQDLAPEMEQATLPVQRYYQLLTIKAQDKAYIPHTSDSLILALLRYYEQGGDPRLLPEAYYYAGRITRDLGDAPQALDYFHQALDAFGKPAYQRNMKGKEHSTLQLQGKIHAQMGYLFRKQHLYDESMKSFELAYRTDSINGDTTMMLIDLRDIGNVLFTKGEYNSAISKYEASNEMARAIKDTLHLFKNSCQIAALYNEIGEYEKAKNAIFEYPISITPSNRSSFYSIIASIFSNTKEYDLAENYFKKLLTSNDIFGRTNANLWIGKRLNDLKRNDAFEYFNRFIQLVDSINRLSNEEAVALSQSLYNYQLREREISNLKISQASLRAQSWMYVALAAIAFSLLYIEHTRRCRMKQRYDHLQSIIASRKQHYELKQKLALATAADLKSSETYRMIGQKLEKQLPLARSDWKEVEATFDSVIPEFLPKLRGIYSFNDTEWKLSLLLKMDFSWHEIATLVSLSYEAVHSSQSRLYKKVFNGDVTYKNWKEFISSL